MTKNTLTTKDKKHYEFWGLWYSYCKQCKKDTVEVWLPCGDLVCDECNYVKGGLYDNKTKRR